MTRRWQVALCHCVAAAALALLTPAVCRAQQTDVPDAPKPQSTSPQETGKAAPQKPAKPAPKDDAPEKNPAEAAPAAPTRKPADAAADNPFPEDVSRGAAAKAAQSDSPDAPAPAADAGSSSSSSSSSNSSGSSSSNANTAGSDPNAEPDVPATSHRRRLAKPRDKDIESGSLTGQARAEEDVKVGRYYLSQRDYVGAYGRFQEAARLDPVNVEAIYGVAASAEGLHKTDEAVENYKLYLQVAPDGEHAKAAERSLKNFPK